MLALARLERYPLRMAPRLWIIACFALFLAACAPEALPFRNPRDRFVVHFQLQQILDHWPCAEQTDEGPTGTIYPIAAEDCFHFDGPQRMRGVWLVGMHSSEFLPDATHAPAVKNLLDDNIWLDA